MDKHLEEIIEMTREVHEAVHVRAEENLEDLRLPYFAYIGISDDVSYLLLTDSEDGINSANIIKSFPGSTETYCNDVCDAAYLYTAKVTPDIELRAYTMKKAAGSEQIADGEINYIIDITKNLRAAVIEFNRKWLSGQQDYGVVCIDITAAEHRNSHILLSGTNDGADVVNGIPGATEDYIPDDETGINYKYTALATPGVIVNAYTTEPVRSGAAANG